MKEARQHQPHGDLRVDPGTAVVETVLVGDFAAKPAQVEDTVDTDENVILRQKIAKRPRNEQLQLIPFLPPQHAQPSKTFRETESAMQGFSNSPPGGRFARKRNTKLHAVCDSQGRPLDLFVTAGQLSDHIGARALLGGLPKVDWLLGDRGHDADWFRDALKGKGIRACISGRKQRNKAVKYDKRRYKRRNRIEIMSGRLKDWRRVATRYDRCPKVFLSTIALAAIVVYWL